MRHIHVYHWNYSKANSEHTTCFTISSHSVYKASCNLYCTNSISLRQASLVFQWPSNVIVCRCWASRTARRKSFLNRPFPRGLLCARAISTLHVLSTLSRQQVQTHIQTRIKAQWSFCPELDFFVISLSFISVTAWHQRQVSSASSAACLKNCSNCFLSPHSRTLRAQMVCHNKSVFSHC